MKLDRVPNIAGLLTVTFVLTIVLASTTESEQAPTFGPGARVCAVHDFGTQAIDALAPSQIGAIALGDDGFYYSTSPSGGKSTTTANQGTMFRFSPATNDFEVRYSFDFTAHGATPLGGLIKGNDAYFYGTTPAGGLFKTNDKGATKLGNGVLFRIKPGDREPEVIHTFRYGDLTGIKPEVCVQNKPCRYSPQQRMNAAGGIPLSAPVLGSDGNLYGVTSGSIGYAGLGVLYKVAPYNNGESAITALCIGGPMPPPEAELTDQQLRDTCMFNGAYGNVPLGLTTGGSGVLFGTTLGTGFVNGTVFKAEIPSGRVTTLYTFIDPKLGRTPYGVILASDGKLYGVTKNGGPLYGAFNPSAGAGVLYRLSPAGGSFEIIHAFNGTTEGSQPVAGLVEATSPNGSKYLYGSTSGGGNLRGVLFRQRISMVGPPVSGDSGYQILHAFPNQWSVTGSFPLSTMVAHNDNTYGLTFYGTTLSGGTANNGVLFRLRGVDFPPVQNLFALPIYSLRADYKHIGKILPIPGQAQPTTIDVYTGAVAQQGAKTPAETGTDNGLMIKTGNCRNPHILQFAYREKIGADSSHFGGLYTLTNGKSYSLTTNLADPNWHTDTSGSPTAYDHEHGIRGPDAYYDRQYGVPVVTGPLSLTFFDQPNFGGTTYLPGAHETWRATFKDYVICNCQVVSEVRWTREVPWIVDLPSSPNVTVDVNKGHQGPIRYVDVSIVPPTDPTLEWANMQVRQDGFDPVP